MADERKLVMVPSSACICRADEYLAASPADLLTDPRVRALVEALDVALWYLHDAAPDRVYDAAKAAFAPFGGVRRD